MKILGFGGSPLAKPGRIEGVCGIVAAASREGRCAVVVSAFGGVTDSLLATTRAAVRHEDTVPPRLDGIERRHRAAVDQLAPAAERAALDALVVEAFAGVRELLHGAHLLREAPPRTLDAVASCGPTLAAEIIAAALRASGVEAAVRDARELIVAGPGVGGSRVREAETFARVRERLTEAFPVPVVAGGIASTADGDVATLGRGGSDLTACLLAAALDAASVELWTDVDGVLSADPRIVPDAVPVPRLGYDELLELSHLDAKVVHPPSVHPARRRGIPLWIKNALRPELAGTLVAGDAPEDVGHAVRGVTSIGSVALLRLEGDGMIGVPGIAERLFGALARENVSVILISQAASEHSICFAVRPDDVPRATGSIAAEFAAERRDGLIDEIVVEENRSVVAAVGAGMHGRCGIAASVLGALGRHGVNVCAIAQGSSERNVSLVVDARDEVRAVNAIHSALSVPGWRQVEIALAGVGRVGNAFLERAAERAAVLERERGIRLRLVAVADSRGAILDPAGVDPGEAAERLRAATDRESLESLVEYLEYDRGAARILVDCTASRAVPAVYEQLLRAGASVVTANKLPFSGPREEWRTLRDAGPGRLRHEATVGAALPVLATLEGLLAAGDRILRIDAVLSGTLGFLLGEVNAGRALSDAVRLAAERGWAEPDPREDLAGRDVARKLSTLARLAGHDLGAADVATESLLPDPSWHELAPDDFRSRLPELDAAMATRRDAAAAAGRRLAYVAELADGRARAGLDALAPAHPCAGLSGTDNLVAFTTERYRESPLVVRGPGAGAAFAASGLFADVLAVIDAVNG